MIALRRFEGKTAVVTGGSRGIGLAIAQRLVDEGAHVVITGRREESLQSAVAEMSRERRVVGVVGSAADPEHQDSAIRAAIDTFGSLDLLVNNAGINPTYGRMIDMDVEVGRKIFETNVLSSVSWVQKAYRASMKDRGGAVVCVASHAGLRPAPMIGMYGASKSALIHVAEELALELAPAIRVNAVAPGVVRTRFAEALYSDREASVVSAYPMGRLGTVADIASTVAFLLSEDAAWITGQTIAIDGGLSLTGGVNGEVD